MTVEITSATLRDGIVTIEAVDCSELNLQRLERYRDDFSERYLTFEFDTHDKKSMVYLHRWMHSQKACKESRTWAEALASIIGTVTDISGRYLAWI